MEIGLFQLENLSLTPMPFAFLDLRTDRAAIHPEIDRLLSRAEVVTPAEAPARLEALGVSPSIPVVLLSEDGRTALDLRVELERLGYAQIYVVEGGARGLLNELGIN